MRRRLPLFAAATIAAIGLRDLAKATDAPATARLITEPQDLASLDLDLVVEAAGRESVGIWGEAALAHAPAFAVAPAEIHIFDRATGNALR